MPNYRENTGGTDAHGTFSKPAEYHHDNVHLKKQQEASDRHKFLGLMQVHSLAFIT